MLFTNTTQLPALTNWTLLILGGGNGFVSARLASDGHNVILLEPGPQGALNAKNHRKLPHVICSTLEDAEIKPRSFDVAGAFDVIEHIKDDQAFVANIAAVIKPGGMFVATVPAHMWLWSNEDDRAGHFRRYTTASLEELLRPFFKPVLVSYLFQPLVLPIALLRALPSRIGMRRNRNTISDSAEHGADGGLLIESLRRALSRETTRVTEGKKLLTGSTVLFVGTRREQ